MSDPTQRLQHGPVSNPWDLREFSRIIVKYAKTKGTKLIVSVGDQTEIEQNKQKTIKQCTMENSVDCYCSKSVIIITTSLDGKTCGEQRTARRI
jgi:hypothetical protein